MRKITLLIITLFITFSFSACTSKSQSDVIDSSSKDISELLRTLIQKEKEINELNKKLEDCQNSKGK
jgi:peptidoglycan hydrolase CwlO-like protein